MFKRIVNKERAADFHLSEITLKDGKNILVINIQVIPKQFNILQFIDFLNNEGIILCDKEELVIEGTDIKVE